MMTITKKRELERRIDDYFYLGEKILVRTLLLASFIHHAGKFVFSMIR